MHNLVYGVSIVGGLGICNELWSIEVILSEAEQLIAVVDLETSVSIDLYHLRLCILTQHFVFYN